MSIENVLGYIVFTEFSKCKNLFYTGSRTFCNLKNKAVKFCVGIRRENVGMSNKKECYNHSHWKSKSFNVKINFIRENSK